MKKIVFFTFLFCPGFVIPTHAQIRFDELTKQAEALPGPATGLNIKKALTWTYDLSTGDTLELSEIFYNEEGFIEASRSYTGTSFLSVQKKIYYNASHKIDSIIQEGEILFDEPVLNFIPGLTGLAVRFWQKEPGYDELLKHNVIRYTYNTEGQYEKITYAYDHPLNKKTEILEKRFTYEKEQLKKIEDYDTRNKLIGSYTFSYNPEGLVIQVKQLKADHTIKTQYSFTYHHKSTQLKEIDRAYLISGELSGHEVVIFDKNGTLLTFQSGKPSTNNKRLTDYAVRSANGYITTIYTYANDLSENAWVLDSTYYQRNNSGFIESTIHTDEVSGEPIRSHRKYTYDAENNWIEIVIDENGKKKKGIKRQIIYRTN